jgi:hypothetical protein
MRCARHVAGKGERSWWVSLRERDNLKDVDVGGKIIIDLKEMVWEGVGWIDLSQSRERWRTVVKTAMNIRFP